MDSDLFSNIFKYRQRKSKSPLENYCTEIFAYILKRMIETEDKMAFDLLELFGFHNIEKNDLKNIYINTQESHKTSVDNKKAILDIIIKLNDIVNIIEVKINSGLNKYNIYEKKIDQIEKYKKINDIKGKKSIYLLSKHVIFCDSLEKKNRILWSQIYSILSNSDIEIVNQFRLFLEENGIKSYVLRSGAENTINSIQAIMGLIEQSWTNKKYKLLKQEITRDYIGFYIKDKETAWIGQIEEKKDFIVFEVFNKLNKKAEENNKDMEFDKNSNYIYKKLSIKKITSYKTTEEQVKFVTKWCNDIIQELLYRDNDNIKNFNTSLEQDGIKKLKDGAENTINSIQAIMGLIEQSWTNEKYKLKEEFTREYIGFWIKDKDTAWIGQIKEKKDFIVFEIIDNKLYKKAKEIASKKKEELDDNNNYIFDKLSIKKITSYKTAEEQVKCVTEWCNKIINDLSLK